ncbi:hypothetical protein J5I95_14220 [Candidatus Poribacteria bacterium]|nr:hypothetical protein [Candidatus Poribacteria bacterium]
MKNCAICLLILILSLTALLGVPLLSAETTADLLQPTFGSDLPEGPSPGNKTHYKTFTFNLNLPNIEDNQSYEIIAKLKGVTKYEGSCANYKPDGLPRKEDLLFHSDDYPNGTEGGWTYKKWDKLTFTLGTDDTDRSVPMRVSVRCYDWGAYGKLTLTFKKKIRWLIWETTDDTDTIPLDANDNKIGDGWEKDKTKNWEADKDDENIPEGTYAEGDGWTVYDEYRGLILSEGAAQATRLDPAAKDVMFCSENTLETYGTGSVRPPHHIFHTIYSGYVLDAFDDIWNYSRGSVSSDTEKDKGWVNQYSKGLRGHDRVPGYKRVWAIRVKDSNRISMGGKLLGTMTGGAIQGSPSQTSLTLVFTRNIKEIIDEWFDDAIRDDESIIPPTAAEKRAIVDAVISNTISHEVAHCLDLGHCNHAQCLMNSQARSRIDWKKRNGPGADGIIGTDDDDIVGTHKYISQNTLFDDAHDLDYAATGAPGFTTVEITVPTPNMPSDPNEQANSGDENSDNTGNGNTGGTTDSTPLTDSTALTPETPSPPTTITYTCGIHSGDPISESSDHKTTIIGYSGSFYECQPHQTYSCGHMDLNNNSSSHALQASCSETDSHGQGCTVTNFYACQSHTHQYPALISGACGHSYTSAAAYNHRSETCPTNSSGQSCTSGSYYACSPHTHAYPVSTGALPVWSDIPDPYNLTIGDSFSLDLSSYVTGSPTFTRNGGRFPAGLLFSDGVLSGTVLRVESRSIRFTATNTAGSVDSEWIDITVTK